MPAPTSTLELLDLVRKSGIYGPQQLDARLKGVPDLPADASQSAAVLVQQGMLTRFQAKLLLAGKYRGFKLGSYVVREQIGQGGMGAVYLAEHETLKRKVALKVLPPVPADGNAKLNVERFLREARSAAALDHPNIVRIHDVARQGEVHYLVMEHVDGQSLEDVLKQTGPIAASRAVEYVAQAAAGLQHAYEKGFIHRDIKPANLMLAKDGTVKLLDMGLARSCTDEQDKLTEVHDEGAIVGTADFISPEQALNAPTIDIRSDIYSLGATFFALVTGTPPFAGNTTQKLMQHQMKDAPSVTTIDRTFPPELAKVVGKMLNKKADKRYQTPAEVIQAVAGWLPNAGAQRLVVSLSGTDLANSAQMKSTLGEMAAGGAGRKRWPLYAAGAAAVAVVASVVGYLAFSGEKPPAVAANPSADVKPAPLPAPVPTPTPSEPVKASPPAATSLFDAADVKPFRLVLKKVTRLEGDNPTLPRGWRCEVYEKDAVGEFRTTDGDGRKAVAVGCREGKSSSQLVFSGPKAFAPNHAYEVRVEYALDPGVKGHVKAELINDWRTIGSGDLKATDGTPGTMRFVAPPIGEVQLIVGSLTVAPGKFVHVRRVTVADAGPVPPPPVTAAGPTVLAVDFRGRDPLRYTVENRKPSADPKPVLPTGVYGHCWKAESVAEFRLGETAGRPAFGVTNLNDALSAQIQVNLSELAGDKLRGGQKYRLTLVYRTANEAAGNLFVRVPADDHKPFAGSPLPGTDGQWKTVQVEFTVPAGAVIDAVVENTSVGEGNTLSVARLDVAETK